MAVVTPSIIDGSTLASGTPTYRLAVGNSYAVGDLVIVMLMQNAHAVPSVQADSLGNTYRFLEGRAAVDSSNLDANGQPTPLNLGYALYAGMVKTGGSRPTLHFTTASTGLVGIRSYSGVSQALGLHGNPVEPFSSQINSGTVQPYLTGASTETAGDLVMSMIVALSQTVVLSTDSISDPGYALVRTFTGSGITLQVQEQSPAAGGFYPYGWDADSNVTAIFSAVGIRHA